LFKTGYRNNFLEFLIQKKQKQNKRAIKMPIKPKPEIELQNLTIGNKKHSLF